MFNACSRDLRSSVTWLCSFIRDIPRKPTELLNKSPSSILDAGILVFSHSEWICIHLTELGRALHFELVLGEISHHPATVGTYFFYSRTSCTRLSRSCPGKGTARPHRASDSAVAVGAHRIAPPGLAWFNLPSLRGHGKGTALSSSHARVSIMNVIRAPLLPIPKRNPCWDLKWIIDWN